MDSKRVRHQQQNSAKCKDSFEEKMKGFGRHSNANLQAGYPRFDLLVLLLSTVVASGSTILLSLLHAEKIKLDRNGDTILSILRIYVICFSSEIYFLYGNGIHIFITHFVFIWELKAHRSNPIWECRYGKLFWMSKKLIIFIVNIEYNYPFLLSTWVFIIMYIIHHFLDIK